VRDIIRAQRDRGATIFLNSHLLSEIEITCDRVVFIRQGEVVTSRDMRAQDEEVCVEVRARKLTQESIAGLAKWGVALKIDEERLTIVTPSRNVLPDVLRHLVAGGADVYQFTPQRMSLEELFLSIMGEDRGL
jgi:ABC-2 type transport system ATP-binding protein